MGRIAFSFSARHNRTLTSAFISAGWNPTACLCTPFSYLNTIFTSSHVTLKETRGPSYQTLLKFPEHRDLSQVIMILVWFLWVSISNVGRCADCVGLVFISINPPAKMSTLYLEFGPEIVTVRALEWTLRFILWSRIWSSVTNDFLCWTSPLCIDLISSGEL